MICVAAHASMWKHLSDIERAEEFCMRMCSVELSSEECVSCGDYADHVYIRTCDKSSIRQARRENPVAGLCFTM